MLHLLSATSFTKFGYVDEKGAVNDLNFMEVLLFSRKFKQEAMD